MFLVAFIYFFFNDTATTEIYTLSLHDALPISWHSGRLPVGLPRSCSMVDPTPRFARSKENQGVGSTIEQRSEEHTSELQSHLNLVCRLLLEKKKTKNKYLGHTHQARSIIYM